MEEGSSPETRKPYFNLKPISTTERLLSPQYWLDLITTYLGLRWGLYLFFAMLYYFRVIFVYHGFYALTYFWAVAELGLLVRYLTPENPEDADLTGEYMLPGINPEAPNYTPSDAVGAPPQMKRFIRHLPEFHFWKRSMALILLVNVLCCFRIFDIPVMGIVLLVYFIILAIFALRNPIKQMIKTKVYPWTTNLIEKKA